MKSSLQTCFCNIPLLGGFLSHGGFLNRIIPFMIVQHLSTPQSFLHRFWITGLLPLISSLNKLFFYIGMFIPGCDFLSSYSKTTLLSTAELSLYGYVIMANIIATLASRRQTIIFSSDDSRSLHIIVCYYRWGRNRCWAIRSQFGGKGRQNGLICNYGSDHVHMSGSVLSM